MSTTSQQTLSTTTLVSPASSQLNSGMLVYLPSIGTSILNNQKQIYFDKCIKITQTSHPIIIAGGNLVAKEKYWQRKNRKPQQIMSKFQTPDKTRDQQTDKT
jgi:hypothetical protein